MNIFKSFAAIGVAAFTSILVSSCGSPATQSAVDIGSTGHTSPPAASSRAKTEIVHREKSGQGSGEPGTVAAQGVTEAALTFTPSDHAVLLKDPDLAIVVRGVVTGVEYGHDEVGTTYTQVTLQIDETIRGDVRGSISYMELGGFIKASDLSAINGPKDGVPSASPDDGWVDVQFLGATHSRVGDEQVVFLRSNSQFGFEVLQGPYGRYTWNPARALWETLPADTIKDPTMTDEQVLNLR